MIIRRGESMLQLAALSAIIAALTISGGERHVRA
jgi:hypothetical protein